MTAALSNEQAQIYELLLRANKEQTQEIKSEIQDTIKTLTNKLDEANTEIKYLKDRCVNLERKARRNNIILFGIKVEDNSELVPTVLQTLNEILEIEIKVSDINNIYKIGRTENAPVIVEFISYIKKSSLFANKQKLKLLNVNGLSIANDLCEEDREEQKILLKHRRIALEQNDEAKIKGRKLYVNNQPFTSEELKNLENKTETENFTEDSNSEEEEGEDQEEEKRDQGTQSGIVTTNKNLGKANDKNKQPLAQSSNTQQTLSTQKRKRRKLFKYSPKNTRSNKK
ncbi:unnamed protein product [Phaedon cochleariae]|uniref:Endonuclease-reverse transcriptase n=1 Tax=Phaedon cochleariae TaxID=80249 RepID=A0A9N9X459_PHACE|nr:unnamed protein product [Phaedon cochleariae]